MQIWVPDVRAQGFAAEARRTLDGRRGKHYASKPRPVLVVQDDRFDATDSVTIFPLTTDPTEIPLLRIRLDLRSDTGLTQPRSIMIDKLTTMPRAKLGDHIGEVSDTELLALARSLVAFSVSPEVSDLEGQDEGALKAALKPSKVGCIAPQLAAGVWKLRAKPCPGVMNPRSTA
ncbi:MAG: hypothetical protein DLM54_04200 [Acidimicrobiales bacterium]|nr:MAG: hypothetical protein DLM54_04200 [Acidimicrobiales bacterium]